MRYKNGNRSFDVERSIILKNKPFIEITPGYNVVNNNCTTYAKHIWCVNTGEICDVAYGTIGISIYDDPMKLTYALKRLNHEWPNAHVITWKDKYWIQHQPGQSLLTPHPLLGGLEQYILSRIAALAGY